MQALPYEQQAKGIQTDGTTFEYFAHQKEIKEKSLQFLESLAISQKKFVEFEQSISTKQNDVHLALIQEAIQLQITKMHFLMNELTTLKNEYDDPMMHTSINEKVFMEEEKEETKEEGNLSTTNDQNETMKEEQ